MLSAHSIAGHTVSRLCDTREGDSRLSIAIPAKRPRRLARPRTSPFHGGNTGSNPVGDAIESKTLIPNVRTALPTDSLRAALVHTNTPRREFVRTMVQRTP